MGPKSAPPRGPSVRSDDATHGGYRIQQRQPPDLDRRANEPGSALPTPTLALPRLRANGANRALSGHAGAPVGPTPACRAGDGRAGRAGDRRSSRALGSERARGFRGCLPRDGEPSILAGCRRRVVGSVLMVLEAEQDWPVRVRMRMRTMRPSRDRCRARPTIAGPRVHGRGGYASGATGGRAAPPRFR